VRRLDEVTALISVVVAVTPPALCQRMIMLRRAASSFNAVDPSIQLRVRDVDTLDRRRQRNLLVTQLIGGCLK
jgi:hypothetical protein